MKATSLKDRLKTDDSREENQTTKAISEALSSNDKVIEIRPAKRSRGMGLKRLAVMAAGAIGLAYWARNSRRPDELIGRMKRRTADRTHKAAESIEEGTESASHRIEAGSERAGEAVQEAGERMAERTEEAGEKAADEAEKSSQGGRSSSGSSSGSSSSSKN